MLSITPLQTATESSPVPKSERKTTGAGRRAVQPARRARSATIGLRTFTARPYSSSMDDLREQVADLARRVRALEDELAIHRQIVRYGFAVDTGDADAAAALFTEEAVYDVDGPLRMEGRDGVRAMV